MLSNTENPIALKVGLGGTEVSRDAPLEGRWNLMLLYLARVYGFVSSSVPRVIWGREGLL